MKLEDEIQVIFDDEFNTHPHTDDEIKAIEKIKSLIERYCKRQRELCAKQGSEVPCLDENERAEVYYHIERNSKLATEE